MRPWQRAADAVLAAALASIGIAEVWIPLESVVSDGSPHVSTLAILLSAACLALRRTHPLASVGVFAVWMSFGITTLGHVQALFFGGVVPFMVALYSAARHGRGRVPWIVAGAGALTLLFADLAIPELQGWSEIVFHWSACGLAFAIGWGLRVAELRAVSAALEAQEATARAQSLAERAVRDERIRIARELHDVLAHTVSVMIVQAGAAEELLTRDPEAARRAMEQVRATGNDALDEVRGLVSLWRSDEPPLRTPQPGVEAIGELVAAVQTSSLTVDVRLEGHVDAVPPGLGLAAYRIVQESLTNVRKHSNASRATVRVTAHPSMLTVEVDDDGSGVAVATTPGSGLLGMRERASMYGGRFDATPTESGFRVRAELPRSAAP